MTRELKLAILSITSLAACVASYILFFMVSWKLFVGILLAHFSRIEYENLVRELTKEPNEDVK